MFNPWHIFLHFIHVVTISADADDIRGFSIGVHSVSGAWERLYGEFTSTPDNTVSYQYYSMESVSQFYDFSTLSIKSCAYIFTSLYLVPIIMILKAMGLGLWVSLNWSWLLLHSLHWWVFLSGLPYQSILLGWTRGTESLTEGDWWWDGISYCKSHGLILKIFFRFFNSLWGIQVWETEGIKLITIVSNHVLPSVNVSVIVVNCPPAWRGEITHH